ncbi:tetranectin-like protein [Erpetoichthys calabaricus]|uniref:tetranectin-like protein n=1 Tax=Erpetoichthys calabaricus TaxID=27687 RepID=UPI0022341BB8|nr:tetranectin-like protein [Erpetoichthys calabaricus]
MAQMGCLLLFLIIGVTLDRSSGQPGHRHSKPRSTSPRDVGDDDLKAQINKLWQEVNSLKEMQALQTVCLRGTKVHRKCYLAIDVPKHFHEANEDCIAQGGTLVTPRDTDENTAVHDYAKKSLPGAKDFWIGITDMVKEGQYVDVNGMAINYFNWDRSKNQPTGVKRESCVMMSQASQGKWHDDVCRNLKKYICEYIIP